MALTREERQAIETLIKTVTALEEEVKSLTERLEKAEGILLKFEPTNMADWTTEEWRRFLMPYLTEFMSNYGSVSRHNHTNDQQGGDCFAKLGANLINGED